MSTTEIILVFVLFVAAFTAFVVGGMQLACRGPLLNNLYPEVPEDADYQPDKSGVAIMLVGVVMLVNAAAIFLHNSRICLINAVLLPVIVIFVIATAAMMEGKK